MDIVDIMKAKKCRIWEPVNIYPTAHIGEHVNIGMFSEIGDGVVVGDYSRIGAGSFLCHGVVLEAYVFVGPHVIFTHDRYFPSGGKGWEKTVVKRGARIGAGSIILPGVTIGENAMIGAGSIVTRDVPAGETWCGSPAKRVRDTVQDFTSLRTVRKTRRKMTPSKPGKKRSPVK